MRVKDGVPKVKGVAVGFGGFFRRRKRLTVAVVVAALLVGPLLLTDDGEVFVLNAVGLGRFTRSRDGNQAAQAQRTANTTTDKRRTR